MNGLRDDPDDDMRLPGRGSERHAVREEARAYDEQDSDREFTLSTGTVLGLFFALALVCAVFFGFGYSMGRKSGQASAEAAAASQIPADANTETTAPKPAAGTPVVQTIPGYVAQGGTTAANKVPGTPAARGGTVLAPEVVVAPSPVAVSPKAIRPPVGSEAAAPGGAPVERKAPEPRAPVTIAPPVVAPSGTSSYVQIAAVSHQEDADVLLSALKRRGYTVFARPGDADKLIHVQVGPFATKKDADTMRQKLLGDGYNAIVK